MNQLCGEDLDRLAALLLQAGESVRGPLSAGLIAGGRSNLTYRVDDGTSAWAVRRPPTGGLIESAHDVVREYRVVAALEATDVPVARAVALDRDGEVLGAPCAVVAFVDGRTARSRSDVACWSHADFATCAEGLVHAIALVHAVDPVTVGLGDFGRVGGYAARQLRRWSWQWERMGAADDRAGRLHERLAARVPDQTRSTVVHGDYRVDNVILHSTDPGRVLAVVDWELATLGDPTADVATMCAYRHPALDGVLGFPAAWTSDGFPSPAGLRDMYESQTQVALSNFDFYLALAYFKLAVIAQGIAYRHHLGVTAGEGFEGVAAMVPVLLDAGLEISCRHG